MTGCTDTTLPLSPCDEASEFGIKCEGNSRADSLGGC
jgi:hypothetical protein